MREEQSDEMNKLIKEIKSIQSIIFAGYYGGDYNNVLKYVEQAEALIKGFQGDLPETIKDFHTGWLAYRAMILALKGNLALSLLVANELVKIAQLYNSKKGISLGKTALGIYYSFCGELDKALVHLDRAIRLNEETFDDLWDAIAFVSLLHVATRVSIEKEDLESAKRYFNCLEEIAKAKPTEPFINCYYLLAKGYLLKSSMRSRDRVMAEDLFKEIIENVPVFSAKLFALSGLSELLLVELRFSNDINIISEIKPLIEKLIEMAQPSGLYYFLIEAYILHGKLALIMFDIESSRRYLTQARRMAERLGFIGFANEITSLHEDMMEKIDTWEQLEKINAPLSERMELAQLNDHLKGKFRSRMMKMERVSEGEVTVYKGSQTCLVCKGGAEGYNVFICPNCKTIYCKTCAEAVTDLENQCWSCNSPIDASKPVKPYKPVKEAGNVKKNKKPKKY